MDLGRQIVSTLKLQALKLLSELSWAEQEIGKILGDWNLGPQ